MGGLGRESTVTGAPVTAFLSPHFLGTGPSCQRRIEVRVQFSRFPLTVLALLVSTPVRAQDLAQAATLRAATCETWNEAKPPSGQSASAARAFQLSLVFDYIVAHDREPDRDYYAGQIDLTDGVDAAEIAAWMDGYCAANPRDGLEQAAAALMRDLEARWITRQR